MLTHPPSRHVDWASPVRRLWLERMVRYTVGRMGADSELALWWPLVADLAATGWEVRGAAPWTGLPGEQGVAVVAVRYREEPERDDPDRPDRRRIVFGYGSTLSRAMRLLRIRVMELNERAAADLEAGLAGGRGGSNL